MSAEATTRDWLKNQIRQQIGAVISGMTGQEAEASWTDRVPEPSGPPASLVWKQGFSMSSEARLWLSIASESEQELGELILGDGTNPVSADECRGTLVEILGQIGSAVARDLSGRLGREITPEGGEISSEKPGTEWETLTVAMGTRQLRISVGCEDLWALITANEANREVARPEAAASPALESLTARSSKTMDLLLDVEMPVSISFGRAQLPLKDVLKLSSGSIVELNRAIIEPVEVIVNNCVIARGEVVVVEGNYGVKIQQIISRQERLRTLH